MRVSSLSSAESMSAATGSLQQQAIQAAKQADWQKACALNQAILEKEPDIGAYNRLGIAQLQLGNTAEARQAFEEALQLDTANPLAKKNLERLKKKDPPRPPLFSKQHYIEEPGKTKIIELHRLAGKETLATLTAGDQCQLKCKKRFISVEVDGTYIGALPEDLSFRLAKLILQGNTYSCQVRSATHAGCSVFIRELTRSQRNQTVTSFPINRSTLLSAYQADEPLVVDEETDLGALEFETETDTESEEVEEERGHTHRSTHSLE